ncbi:hypothetical protein [Luteolibacter sp. LG18]|uniref:hypothetical protein n=1 Tax=Luteolibacter sp. LG18 TaxID=2819286 RepID=UPI002B2D40AE|nr:hypothetical protein llg_10070 [Luteolibacter sp. LG18]
MKPIRPLLTLTAALAFAMPVGAEEPKPAPKPPELAREDTPEGPPGSSDPFAADSAPSSTTNGIPAARLKENRPAVHLRIETWQIPTLEITRKLDAGQDAAEVAKWREEWLGKPDAAQLVLSPAISVDASTRMKAESIREFIYPTEYEPPELQPTKEPANAPAKADPNMFSWLSATLTKATPTAFETRNTGTTLEALGMPVTTAKDAWDILATVEDVALLGFNASGEKEMHIEMPCFSSFRTGGLTRLRLGEWRLLSVMSPPGGLDPARPKDRWVTLIRIDPVK